MYRILSGMIISGAPHLRPLAVNGTVVKLLAHSLPQPLLWANRWTRQLVRGKAHGFSAGDRIGDGDHCREPQLEFP